MNQTKKAKKNPLPLITLILFAAAALFLLGGIIISIIYAFFTGGTKYAVLPRSVLPDLYALLMALATAAAGFFLFVRNRAIAGYVFAGMAVVTLLQPIICWIWAGANIGTFGYLLAALLVVLTLVALALVCLLDTRKVPVLKKLWFIPAIPMVLALGIFFITTVVNAIVGLIDNISLIVPYLLFLLSQSCTLFLLGGALTVAALWVLNSKKTRPASLR